MWLSKTWRCKPDDATLCTLVMRPRELRNARLPALLQFTIYADPVQNVAEARQSAAHGYAGVVGLTRGKGCSPSAPSVYQHDGQDAAASSAIPIAYGSFLNPDGPGQSSTIVDRFRAASDSLCLPLTATSHALN